LPAERLALHVAFLIYTAVMGLLVGWATARSPQFVGLGLPAFAWLVLGMLAFELLAGRALKAHPAALLPMGWRLAGLLVAFAACYGILTLLQAG
jgi:hypothetical protein